MKGYFCASWKGLDTHKFWWENVAYYCSYLYVGSQICRHSVTLLPMCRVFL